MTLTTFRVLEPVRIFLVIIFVFLVWLFFGHIWQSRLEGLADDCALEHRVVALWLDRALLVVQDLVELILGFSCFGLRSIAPPTLSGLRLHAGSR